jgi:hypothetical protein
MSRAGVVVTGLFRGHIAQGLQVVGSEIRHVLIAIVGGAIRPNLTGIEYAIFRAAALGSLTAPILQGNNGTTNAAGEFAVSATGVASIGEEVLIITREAAGVSGGADDIVGIGFDTVSPA